MLGDRDRLAADVGRVVEQVVEQPLEHGVQAAGADVVGLAFVQTDVWDIAIDAISSFDGDLQDRFVNLGGEWSFWKQGNPYGVRSWREQNAEETDLPIWRLLYRR